MLDLETSFFALSRDCQLPIREIMGRVLVIGGSEDFHGAPHWQRLLR